MKRSAWMMITLSAVTVARASDIATTLHFNPSLSREVNPIVALLGRDAKTLVLSNMLGLVVLLLIPLLFYWRCPPKRLQSTPSSVWDFASLLLYDRILTRWQFVRATVLGWPLPKDWTQVLRLWGFAGSWAVAFVSFIAAISWWAVWQWQWTWYQTLRSCVAPSGYPVIELLPVIPAFYIAAVVFFRSEFKNSRIRHAKDEGAESNDGPNGPPASQRALT